MPSLDDVLNKLRAIALDLNSIDLWPPWDAAQTIVDAVSEAVTAASTPPPPCPDTVREAATDWTVIGRSVTRGHDALVDLQAGMSARMWQGASGDSFRGSVSAFAARVDTVGPAADDVAAALTTFAASMTDARARHETAFDELRQHLQISWGDLNPLALKDKLAGIVESVIRAIQDLVAAYELANDAHAVCKEAIVAAMDQIDLPHALPEGASPIDAVSEWEAHGGPLAGDVIERYNLAFGELSAEERTALKEAMASADSDAERAYMMAGVAGGLTGLALANYLKKLSSLSHQQLQELDPMKFPFVVDPHGNRLGPVQPDGTTCGSSSLVMARMRNDPAYAMWVTTGDNPETGETTPGSAQSRFNSEAEAMHDRTNAAHDRNGDRQWPYLKAIGTAPWAVATEMSADGGSGVSGTDYGVDTVDPDDRKASYHTMVAAVEDGHSVPMYVGNSVLPGHVVLVTGVENDTLTVYNPGNGQTVHVTREQFVDGNLPFGSPAPPLHLAGPMTEPWFTVVPK